MSCIHCSKPTKGEKFCPACGGLQPGVAPSALSGTSGGAKAGILKAQPQSAFKSGTILQAAPPARASGAVPASGSEPHVADKTFADTTGTSATIAQQYGTGIGEKVACHRCGELTDQKFCHKCGELQKTGHLGSIGGVLSPRAK